MKTTEIASAVTLTFSDAPGSPVEITIDGRCAGVITSNWDRTEVQDRIVADMRGERGAAFVVAHRAGDVRAQRRTWRMLGA